jgi:hypothetical protein
MDNCVNCWNTPKLTTPQRGPEGRARRFKKSLDTRAISSQGPRSGNATGSRFNEHPRHGSRVQRTRSAQHPSRVKMCSDLQRKLERAGGSGQLATTCRTVSPPPITTEHHGARQGNLTVKNYVNCWNTVIQPDAPQRGPEGRARRFKKRRDMVAISSQAPRSLGYRVKVQRPSREGVGDSVPEVRSAPLP